jgi:hypothetical protein
VTAVSDLALRLWGSPDARSRLPAPDPAERIDATFRGELSHYPVAVLCAAGQPPMSEASRAWIDRLRTFVLSVALDYAEAGNPADRHIATVSRNLRRACDDPSADKLLTWFVKLRTEANSLVELSDAIVAKCEGARASDRASGSLPASLVTALIAVAQRRELPGAAQAFSLHLPALSKAAGPGPRALDAAALEEPGELVGAGDEEGVVIASAEVAADETPEQSAAVARGVVFETVEGLHFLPFGWQRTTPAETAALFDLVSSLLESDERSNRLLGAILAIALACGHSMETVGTVPLDDEPAVDWKLDLGRGVLIRLPARRMGRWAAAGDAAPWVRPLASRWTLQLNRRIHQELRAGGRESNAVDLASLWKGFSEISLERAFNAACRGVPALRRVSSGLVRRAVQTTLYRTTQDAPFARLALSGSRTALPGACAYPSWTAAELEAAWSEAIPAAWFASVDFGEAGHNSLGSELDPVDSLLKASIAALRHRVKETVRDPGRWIEHHNALTGYVVTALLCATGARPVDSPFESPENFDWDQSFVFIDDKAVSRGESGRVVPLPPALLQLVEQHYVRHLMQVAGALAPLVPAFAGEVKRLSDKRASRLPFFFFLRGEPSLDWISVSPASLDALAIVDWPLPWNLMRHRLARRLRLRGIDSEIVDGLLGHSEAGTETWGEASVRTWSADASATLPALESAYQELGFGFPAGPPAAVTPALKVAEADRLLNGRSPFGSRARRAQRSADHERARKQAQTAIDIALKGRPISSLSSDEMDALGRSMILKESGLPHPYADLRYEVFERCVRVAWRSEGRRPKLRRRFAFGRAAPSPFHEQCTGAVAHRVTAVAALAGLDVTASRIGPNVAAYLAAVSACTVSRISDPKVLEAIVRRRDVVLVANAGAAWIEHRPDTLHHPDQPATRFPITAQAAAWIDRSLDGPPGSAPASTVPPQLKGLALRFAHDGSELLTASELLKHLITCVRQANALELPGVVAAHLDGRVTSWGAPPADWVRLLKGKAYEGARSSNVPESRIRGKPGRAKGEGSQDHRVAEQNTGVAMRPPSQSADVEERIDLAKRLLKEVRQRLEAYGNTGARGQEDTAARRDLRRELTRLARNADPRTPPSIIALAAWVVQLLERRVSKPHFLRPSSITRYLNALAPRFMDHAHDVDLAELDGEDLTELYAQMLEAGGDDEDPYSGYAGQRLVEFHRFAQREYGLDEPDWSEVGLGGAVAVGAPGIVLEAEYLHALQSIVPDPRGAERRDLCAAMLLLLSFRFGLRGKEAYGLLRQDWADHFEAVVVLVRSNHIRALKTLAGQRQVPLLGRLEPVEWTLIRRWLATWDAVAEGDERVPLFAFERTGTLPELRMMRKRAREALRVACRTGHTTLHHARHAFAIELYIALVPAFIRPVLGSTRWLEPGHVQQLLLGDTRSTRRALWALARALGHARPATSLKSYVHVLPETVARLVRGNPEQWDLGAMQLRNAENLDRLALDPSYLRAIPRPPVAAVPTPTVLHLVEAAQLLARGQSSESVAFTHHIEASTVRRLRDWLAMADQRLVRNRRSSEQRPARRSKATILGQILRRRWQALIAMAKEASVVPVDAHEVTADPQQVGPAVQLVLWREEHFRWLAGFLQAFDLRQDVVVFETDELVAKVAAWAQTHGITERKRQQDEQGTRIFQIDGMLDGDPPQRVVHRCAAARAPDSARLRSGAEMLLLWACYAIAASRSVAAEDSAARTKSG